MSTEEDQGEPFPWHLGVYDAHCHPTDTMASISSIKNMKARVLTIMATRAEDQDLVLSTAATHGIKSPNPSIWSREECIIPSFGWHPWFAHQMHISNTSNTSAFKLTDESKIQHYQSVLHPARPSPLSPEDRTLLLSLPDPLSFSAFLSSTRAHLAQHPHALVGEIGLDRSFRIPESWSATDDLWAKRDPSLTPGGREGRRLTPFKCSLAHQKAVLKAQLQLAAELGRAVSVHGVQAHGVVFETLAELWKGHERVVLSKRERKKRGRDHPSVEAEMAGEEAETGEKVVPYPPRICLHSYSGSPSNFKQYCDPAIPARVFASFSTAINLGDTLKGETPKAFEELVRMVPDHMLLVESDLHTAGEEMDKRLEDIVRRICKIKGWSLEYGVFTLGHNWKAFVFGE